MIFKNLLKIYVIFGSSRLRELSGQTYIHKFLLLGLDQQNLVDILMNFIYGRKNVQKLGRRDNGRL